MIYDIDMFIKFMILKKMPNVVFLITICLILWISNGKCHNSTDFKYDLKEVS